MVFQSVKMTNKLIERIAQHEVRGSKYRKKIGKLTRLGGSVSITHRCKYLRSHELVHTDFQTVRESAPKVS